MNHSGTLCYYCGLTSVNHRGTLCYYCGLTSVNHSGTLCYYCGLTSVNHSGTLCYYCGLTSVNHSYYCDFCFFRQDTYIYNLINVFLNNIQDVIYWCFTNIHSDTMWKKVKNHQPNRISTETPRQYCRLMYMIMTIEAPVY